MAAHCGIVKHCSIITFMVCCLMLGGCGKHPNLPPMAKVHGKITFRGEPVSNACIEFYPDQTKGTNGPMAVGQVESDGTYTVTTRDGKGGNIEGVVVGFHRVCIVPISPNPNSNEIVPRSTKTVPRKYTTSANTDLIVEIKAGKDNECDFELKP
ncbi:MAG: hypothetical protein JW818_08745 [Pirellulales bacterium]|nr:hypothetical protein [Pirellulales bacterium]